jgi:hypothetical protein
MRAEAEKERQNTMTTYGKYSTSPLLPPPSFPEHLEQPGCPSSSLFPPPFHQQRPHCSLTKSPPHSVIDLLSSLQGLVRLLPAILALSSHAVVLADARPAALLAPVPFAVVLADARPAAFLAPAPSAVVLADARPAELLAPASSAVVLADARPCLHWLLWRLCSQMLAPPHCLHWLLTQLAD